MPPRKRKAVANSKLRPVRELSPINENAPPAGHDDNPLNGATPQINGKDVLEQAFARIESRAQEQCQDIISAASKASRTMELDFETHMKRLAKVREQRVASLLELSAEEASSTDLGPVLRKLAALLRPDGQPAGKEAAGPPQAVEQGVPDAPCSSHPAQGKERKQPAEAEQKVAVAIEDDVGAAQQRDQEQLEAGGRQAAAGPSSPAQAAAAKSPQQQPFPVPARRATRAAAAAPAPVASTPGPPPTRAGRRGAAPAPAAAVAATPAGAALGCRRLTRQAALAMETPVAAGGASDLAPPGSASFNGFTLMTRTAATAQRGKTRRRAVDNVIMINTLDGQQFQIDGDQGLEGVPEQSRAEVAQQLEVMQRLVAAALMKR